MADTHTTVMRTSNTRTNTHPTTIDKDVSSCYNSAPRCPALPLAALLVLRNCVSTSRCIDSMSPLLTPYLHTRMTRAS